MMQFDLNLGVNLLGHMVVFGIPAAWQVAAWPAPAWLCAAWQGAAWLCAAWQGAAWQGAAWVHGIWCCLKFLGLGL